MSGSVPILHPESEHCVLQTCTILIKHLELKNKKKMRHTYSMEYYSTIQGTQYVICKKMNGNGDYVKRKKPDIGRQIYSL